MRDLLAESLLAKVMGWSPHEVAGERVLLKILGDYKYDEYQQFSPGMRFVESLAQWLEQFNLHERKTAYEFIKSKLVYCSSLEINHLVSVSYPDHIRLHLLKRVGRELGLSPWHLGRMETTIEFRALERQTLFLGLSDGARTDVFRRTNPDLSHEQVRQSHELADERAEKLLGKLREGLTTILGRPPREAEVQFRTIVLLDDFSASGLSYLRRKGDSHVGKIGTFLTQLFSEGSPIARLACTDNLDLLVVLYLATDHARSYLKSELTTLCEGRLNVSVLVVFPMSSEIVVRPGHSPPLDALIDAHYDDTNETESTQIGGTDLKYGFAECGLPLVMSHNTPNNSLGLLWARGPKMRPLFPRVTRHRDRV